MNKRRAEESSETSGIRPHRLRGVEHNLINEKRVKNIPNRTPRKRSKRLISLLALAALIAASLWLLPSRLGGERVVRAASPSSGTIGPTGPVTPADGKWHGTATGGATASTDPLDGENGCVEGTNCDTFTLTVLPGAYTGKVIHLDVTWTSPSNDYDLAVYKGGTCPATGKCNGTLVSSSGNGATNGILTEEHAQIDPTASGVGDYKVRIIYYNAPPGTSQADPPNGVFSLATVATARTANYISGGITFSPNVTTKAPVASRDGEPSSRTDVQGNFYSVGIRGFPAGIDLWYNDLRPTVGGNPNPNFDSYLRNWVYRGQPDAFSPATTVADLGGDGGGDVDLAVSRPDPTTAAIQDPPILAGSSLIAANISTFKSADRGQNFTKNNLGNCTGGVCADDRQWEEFFGNNTVYLFYRTLAPAVSQIQRSTDGGLTFGPAQTAGAIGQAGYIDVDQKTGRVYISGSSGQVCHSTVTLPTGEAAVYQCVQAASDPNGVAHLFFVVKVADDNPTSATNGTVYVAYSNDHDIFLVHSTDGGTTWSAPVRVSNGAETKTSVFPWIETGPEQGSVGIVWYGTTDAQNDDNANWNVFYAQSFNATADTPTFRQAKISDHFIHGSNISEGGTLGNANRNLLDYFQVSFDPTGAAVVAYTDDHNDFDGFTYIARQITGPANNGKTNVPAPGPTPAAQPGPFPFATDPSVGGEAGAQVTDFRDDVAESVTRINADDPLDILSIRYSCETGTAGEPVIVATMKVSNLSTVPPSSNWRMNFTANAPFAGLSPTGDYSFA
ncbi:MAG: glycoside hydrolase, partial [Acidobacteriota bacterium]|nr:glycoside hydrolase [Acidobacteriota bacterium]